MKTRSPTRRSGPRRPPRLAAAAQRRGIEVRSASEAVAPRFPTANGAASPPATADPGNDRIVAEFREAYFIINQCWAHLRQVRARPQEPAFARSERAALQAIENALRHRDELEDRYAPRGVIAEPIARDGFTVDLQFAFGSTDASGRYRSEPIISSAELALPARKTRGDRDLRPPGSVPGSAGGPTSCES